MPIFKDSEFGDVHKRLLQALIARGCIRGSRELEAMFRKCLEQSGREFKILRFVK